MPLLGAHTSISGGLARALFRGRDSGCRVVQIFTRNASRWRAKALSQGVIEAFLAARDETSVQPVAAHNSYLINLASPQGELREKSHDALLDELQRAERLEIPYLVMHPGAHMGEGEAVGLGRIVDGLKRVCDHTAAFRVKILLETTAGQGTTLGYCFEHLARILDGVDARHRMGVCLDTCHVFAAGYDFRTHKTYRALIREFDRWIGLDRLKVVHINDAKKGLGSRVDRHEHVGLGSIGQKALSFFLNDPAFKDLPFLIETPKGRDDTGREWDERNLELLRKLVKGSAE